MADYQLSYHQYLNDPIWGEIPVTAVEWKIINSRPFRRLQHIKQMGLAYLSFPTANHRRFEHSIGTMHVATKLFEIVHDLLDSSPVDIQLSANHLQAVRLAALLHDIGHPPYSHAFEEAASRNPALVTFTKRRAFRRERHALISLLNNPQAYDHELFTRFIIENDPEISEILDDFQRVEGFFPTEQIAQLAIGEATYKGLRAFNSILSGDFDADRIDYICRDSYYCGFQQRFNISDLRRNMRIVANEPQTRFSLLLTPEAIPAVTTLLWYRYRLTSAVHLDAVNRIATQMLVSLLADVQDKVFGAKPRNLETEQEKLDLFIRFHTIMTDEDFNAFLREHTDERKVEGLLTGAIFDQVDTLQKRFLHPEERLWIHLFSKEQRRISEVERAYARYTGLDQVVVDLRLPKAPTFSTLVQIGNDRQPRSVFDNFFSPHGIMIDTFNLMAVKIYAPDADEYYRRSRAIPDQGVSERFKSRVPGWRYSLYVAMRDVYKSALGDRTRDSSIYSLEMLMLFMGIVHDLSVEKFGMSLWITGDWRLQVCIKRACDRLKNRWNLTPQYRWTGYNYSIDCFVDFEILQNAGLVDHIHLPVGGPSSSANEPGPWTQARIDRRISRFGIPYYRDYLVGGVAYTLLHKEIYSAFKAGEEAYRRYADLEAELRRGQVLVDEEKELRKQSTALRDELTRVGFPLMDTRWHDG